MNERTCPLCHTSIPEHAPGGLCPACVLRGADEPAAAPSNGPTLEEVAAAFPKLEILRLIGHGGMGYVYQARQPELDRMVALKILSPSLRADPAFEERFAREARVLGKLKHPNIVTLYESGESGGYFYLMMEFVDGVNLRQAMSAGRFSPEQALAIVPAICDALQSAHAQGVWHRDIKPENILLDRDGGVKIADFGIARIIGDPERNFTLTRTGGQLGSAAYMAPEQHEKPHSVDHRADIYSLGVVIYEMLTGELPLGRFPLPSQRAEVNARIDEIVMRTLEKERELRQQSAGEVKTEVEHLAGELSRSPLAEHHGLKSGTALQTPRFSRTAIVGACLVVAPFVIWLLGPKLDGPFRDDRERVWFGIVQVFEIVVCVVSAVLGWVAVSQIRRSSGRLRGLGLAVFDGLFFPLMALNGLIVLFWFLLITKITSRTAEVVRAGLLNTIDPNWKQTLIPQIGQEIFEAHLRSTAAIVLLAAVLTIVIVDWLIVRRVWHTVNSPVSGGLGRFLALVTAGILLGVVGMGLLSDYSKTQVASGGPSLSARSGQSSVFSPVIECEVRDFIDLDSSKLIQTPSRKPGTWLEQGATPEWMQQQGIDATWASDGLIGVGITVIPLANEKWDAALSALPLDLLPNAQPPEPFCKIERLEKLPATYGFKTREGGIGLLQIVGTVVGTGNEYGGLIIPKIRYKLVKGKTAPAATVSAASDAKPDFSPVRERVLPMSLGSLFQFRSGEVFTPSSDAAATDEGLEKYGQQVEAVGGFDMTAVDVEDGIQICGHGCIFTKDVADLKWGITPAQVLEAMKRATFTHGVVQPQTKEFPVTYLFKTVRGEVGIMEVFGAVTEERGDGMKFRYKLVQGVATPPATSATAQRSVFGLQAERMITARDANRDGVVAFRFENNLPFMVPEKLTGHFRQHETRGFTAELKQWMKDEKVDLLLHFGDKDYDVLSLEMRDGFAGQPTEWETISPDRAAPLLAQMEKLNTNPGPQIAGGSGYRDGSSGVQVFRTRDGTVGYYQLRGFSDPEGHGVVIRYKLILTEQVKPASATTIASPSFGPIVQCFVATGKTKQSFYSIERDAYVETPPTLPRLPRFEDQSAEAKAALAQYAKWLADNDVDFLIQSAQGGENTLALADMLARPVLEEHFTDSVPEVMDAFKDNLAAGHPEPLTPLLLNIDSRLGTFPTTIFKTRKGRLGVLQVVGVSDNPRGVNVRYKLVKDGVAKTAGVAASTTSATFGPVIERELKTPANNALPNPWLDLDGGKEISLADIPGGDLDAPPGFANWLRQQGADLSAAIFSSPAGEPEKGPSPPREEKAFQETGLFALGECGLRAMAVKPEFWNSVDAKTLLALETALAAQAESKPGQKVIPDEQTPENPKGKLPATFLFKTAAGRHGLLQILDFTEGMQSVKFRYKLVQGAMGAKAPQSNATTSPEKVRTVQASFEVGTMAASSDGKLVAVGNDQPTMIMVANGRSKVADNWQPRVEILDAVTGKVLATPVLMSKEDEAMLAESERAPLYQVTALAFSPDGLLLAVGNSAGQVKLFDAHTGALVRSLDDAEGKKTDQWTPEKCRSFTRAIGSVTALAFSPDGSSLAVCGGAIADVRLFEKSSGISDLSHSPTGPGRLKLWDVKTGALKRSFSGHADDVRAVAFSLDGKQLASAGNWLDLDDKGHIEEVGWGVKIWDAESGKLISKIPDPSNAGQRSIAFSPDGRKIAIASQRFSDKEDFRDQSSGAVTLVQISSRVTEWMHVVPGLAWDVKFSPDGNNVMVLGHEHSVEFLDAKDGAVKDAIRGDTNPKHGKWTSVSFAPGAGLIFLGGNDAEKKGTVEIWNEGKSTAALTPGKPTDTAALAPDLERMRDRGLSLVSLLFDHKYASAVAEFDERLRAAMPEARLAAFWEKDFLSANAGGNFKGADYGAACAMKEATGYRCIVPFRWESKTVEGAKETTANLEIHFNDSGEVTRITSAPHQRTLTFGPVVNGLQAALEMRGAEDGSFTLGQPIEVRFHIRNASKDHIHIADESWRQVNARDVTIKDAKGQKLEVAGILYTGIARIQRVYLQSGESTIFHSGALGFLPEKADAAEAKHPVVNYVNAKPGRYTVSYHLHFPQVVEVPENDGDWKGELDTAPVTIEVKPAGAATSGDAATSPKFGPVIERTLNYRRSWKEAHDALRLSDGMTSKLPPGFFECDEHTNQQWLADGGSKIFPGFVMFPDEPPGPHSWGFGSADVEFSWLPEETWNNPTMERIDSAFADKNNALRLWHTQGARIHCLSAVTKWPATLAFRAGDDSVGVLQILDINEADPEAPIQMKLRYKLVQPSTGNR